MPPSSSRVQRSKLVFRAYSTKMHSAQLDYLFLLSEGHNLKKYQPQCRAATTKCKKNGHLKKNYITYFRAIRNTKIPSKEMAWVVILVFGM